MMNKNIWLLSACQALMMTSNTLLLTTSALVGFALSEDKSLATLPMALQFLSTMSATIPASLLMQRIGRQFGFLVGSVIGCSGAVIASLAIFYQDFFLFCSGVILIGMFNGFGNYYRFAAVDIVSETYKSRAISYVLAGGVLAAVLGPNLANWSHDWITGFKFAGSYASITALYIMTFAILLFADIPRPERIDRLDRGRPLFQIIKQPVFIVAAIGGMFGYGVMSLVMTATPLAMHHHHHAFDDTAFVIQWHVLGMYAPAFFTGQLIQRFGVLQIMMVGALFNVICVVTNLFGHSVTHYWFALLCLGIGWNFLFIGATDLLTEAYQPSEKAKAQAVNDFMVFGTVSAAALTAGVLQYQFGWRMVNMGMIPLITVIVVALVWLMLIRRQAVVAVR